jgi:hypothetical protein
MDIQRELRVFVSSPGDVSEERALAERVLRRLGEAYREVVRLEVIMWEHEPAFAHSGFQDQLQRPSQCDLVIRVLWSKMGTRLPPGEMTGTSGLTGRIGRFMKSGIAISRPRAW